MNQRLQTAMRAARAAGKILCEKLDAPRDIRSKGKRDIVTDADYAADHAVRKILCARYPRDLLLSEEDALATRNEIWQRVERSAERLWVVDPLDGTTNYAHRLPCFAVSIGLYQAGAPQLGVVYDPMRDEMFTAQRGVGAFRNGRPIAVSAARRFANAVIGAEWARRQDLRERTATLFARMVVQSTTGRSWGSAALSLCYVAAGRLDGYFNLALSPWDVAAALLIIEEAGGRVTTPTGEACSIHSPAFVASNGHLHRQLLRHFKK